MTAPRRAPAPAASGRGASPLPALGRGGVGFPQRTAGGASRLRSSSRSSSRVIRMRSSPRRLRRSQRMTATATAAATVGPSSATPAGITPAARLMATGSGAPIGMASVVEATMSDSRSPAREAIHKGMRSQQAPPAALPSVVREAIRRRPARGSIRRKSGAIEAGCQRNRSTSSRTAKLAPAAAAITATVGSSNPSEDQSSGPARGASRAGEQAAAIASVAAESVARHHPGRRRIVTAIPAPQAGSAAFGSIPSRSASCRRRLVAGRVRSEASLIAVLQIRTAAPRGTGHEPAGKGTRPATAGGAAPRPVTMRRH